MAGLTTNGSRDFSVSDYTPAPLLRVSTWARDDNSTERGVDNLTIMADTTPTDIPAPLLSLLSVLTATLHSLERTFHRLPGSPILVRYIKSSYQNDPWRSLLELFLVAFAVRTLLKGRTRGEGEGKNWVKLSEKVGRRRH